MKNIENMLWILMIVCLAFIIVGAGLVLSSMHEINPIVANEQSIVGFIFFIVGFLALIAWSILRLKFTVQNPDIAKQFKLKKTSTMHVS